METRKKLGLFTMITLVSGNMIGSGIFLLPSNLAAIGSITLYSWLFTAIGAIILAIIFAILSTKIQKVGGPYAYVKSTMGNFMGFQTAYNYWIAIWVGNAAIVIALVSYLSVFIPVLSNQYFACYAAIAIIWFLTILNCLSVKSVGIIQAVSTVLKLLPIGLIMIAGWFFIKPEYYTTYYNISGQSDESAILLGITLTLWAFIGLESATVPSDFVHKPKVTIPLATIIGTIIAAVVYIASCAAIMGMISADKLQHSAAPFADAAAIIFGPYGRTFIAFGAIIACFGCLNGWVLLQGQVPMAAAKDSLFPQLFAKCNKNGIPVQGLIITSILITILLLMSVAESTVKQFQIIILLATVSNLIPYFYTAVAFIMFAKNERNLKIKYYFSVLAILGIIYSMLATLTAGKDTIFWYTLLFMLGVFMYAFVKKTNININNC